MKGAMNSAKFAGGVWYDYPFKLLTWPRHLPDYLTRYARDP